MSRCGVQSGTISTGSVGGAIGPLLTGLGMMLLPVAAPAQPVPSNSAANVDDVAADGSLSALHTPGQHTPGQPSSDHPPAPSPGYADRLIAGGTLQPVTEASEEPRREKKGNIRSLVVELGGTRIAPKTRIEGIDTGNLDRVQQEAGISVSGRYQTSNYGMIGIDAEIWRGTASRLGGASASSTNGSFTISDRKLPLGNGWLADSAAGMVSAPALPLMRQQPRFYTPSTPLFGANVTIARYRPIAQLDGNENPEPYASVNLAAGEPGLLGGLRLADFTGLTGLGITGGGQVELSPRWTAGFQAIDIENSRDPYGVVFDDTGSAGKAPVLTSRGALASLAFRAPGWRIQANTIWSNVTAASGTPSFLGSPGTAAGGWIDASHRHGRTSHSGGVYYFAPDLAWGTSAIINNAYGGYYRYSAVSQRWRWTFSLDAVGSVDGRSSSGLLATADIRRQLSFTTSAGINSVIRKADGRTSGQVLGFIDFPTGLGSTRAEVGWSHVPTYDLFRVDWNQNWALPAWLPSGTRLSTQLAFDHRREAENADDPLATTSKGKTNSISAGLSAGASPFNGLSLDATLAFSSNASSTASTVYGPLDAGGGALSALSSQQGRSFSANIAATARLSSKWMLIASVISTRSSLLSRYGLSDPSQSPIGTLPGQLDDRQKSTFRLLAGYLTMRYAVSAGSARGVNGRPEYPYTGTGEIAGHVYLDGNADRRREPDEAGVPGIMVILDGIQAVRTDETGRYRFDSVAEGPHRITVNSDALPLPWSIVSPDANNGMGGPYLEVVRTGVRSTTLLDIAASRE